MISRKIIVIFFIRLLITYDLLAVTAPFTDDMESGTNGWTLSAGNNDWQLGTPSGGGAPTFPTPPPLTHPSRTNCWGTNLNGNYNNNRTSTLTSPQIDVGSSTNPFFTCYTWYILSQGDDAYIETKPVSFPTWNQLERINQNSNSGGWIKKTYNLTGYTGNIQVRFRFVANNKNAALGLYIDNLAIGTNYTAQNRYIIALEPEPAPVSATGTSNNIIINVEVRDLFRYIDSSIDVNTVTMQAVEGNSNSSLSLVSSSPVLSGGKASFTYKNTERETVAFTPSVSGLSLTSISATGEFRSSFRSAWEENE